MRSLAVSTVTLKGFSSLANILKQKVALQKQVVNMKTEQKEMHTATLELSWSVHFISFTITSVTKYPLLI